MKSASLVVLAAMALSACADVPRHVVAPAIDAPNPFMVLDRVNHTQRRMQADATCESPLIDPGTGNTLELVRSSNGLGDYQPSKMAYGLQPKQLLRIDCTTGTAVGAVWR